MTHITVVVPENSTATVLNSVECTVLTTDMFTSDKHFIVVTTPSK